MFLFHTKKIWRKLGISCTVKLLSFLDVSIAHSVYNLNGHIICTPPYYVKFYAVDEHTIFLISHINLLDFYVNVYNTSPMKLLYTNGTRLLQDVQFILHVSQHWHFCVAFHDHEVH